MPFSHITNHVLKHFPNAMNMRDAATHHLGILQNGHGIVTSRLLMAISVCSDENINSIRDSFHVVNGPFFLGGLAGFPHTGLTGMTAFAHHVPDTGVPIILYGPHIGVSATGELGKMRRYQQKHDSGSCGALLLALNRIKEGAVADSRDHDGQQLHLEHTLEKEKDQIIGSDNELKAITEAAYTDIDHQIRQILSATKNEFPTKMAVLLGAILINTDHGVDDFLDIRRFEVVEGCW